MLFSSNVFLFLFLPCAVMIYYLVPRRYKNLILFLFSLVFYAWGEPISLLLMLFIILLNYICGWQIHARRVKGQSAKPVLVAAVVLNLAVLGFFKYTGLVLGTLKSALPFMSGLKVPQIALPIGISFYIFQSMSYTLDVYMGGVKAQKNLLTFGTYVALFPQLIAGPIVRYKDVEEQLDTRRESIAQTADGIILFIIGMGKKVLIANQMGSMWTALQGQSGTAAAWAGMIAYSLQIYFDFSGYSDMACGLGKMFGFEFLKNFDYPYISRSVTEFWRRWHMSLSTWFKEYVYIPLGGNRKGMKRQIFNILVVWSLTGLWHGASWNFVLWGLYYAVLLVMEKLFFLKLLGRMPSLLRRVYLLLAVGIGWMLFYFEDMGQLFSFLARLFVPAASSVEAVNVILAYLPILLIGAVASTPVVKKLCAPVSERPAAQCALAAACAVMLLLCVAALASQSYNPFIYFRF